MNDEAEPQEYGEAAIRAAWERLIAAGKSKDEASVILSEIILDATRSTAPGVVQTLVRTAPRMLRRERRFQRSFEHRLRKDWGTALDLMHAVITSSTEASEMFHRSLVDERDDQITVLTGLHAQAIMTSREVLELLGHGYPSGALARARTIHELAVIATVISDHGHDDPLANLAERFILHGSVMAYKEAVVFQKHAEALGYEPYSDDEIESMKAERDSLITRFGEPFANTYGWASALLKNPNPNFAAIEELAQMSHMRPYYTWQSHAVHADSRGLALNVVHWKGAELFAAGPTNVGLADPAQIALQGLIQCTIAILLAGAPYPTRVIDMLSIQSLRGLANRAIQEFAEPEAKILKRHERLIREKPDYSPIS